MSERALVDSNVLVGGHLQRDQHFPAGRRILSGAERRRLPGLLAPTPVVKETVDLVHRRAGQSVAVDTLRAIRNSERLRIRHVTESDLSTAATLFGRYDGLSTADGAIVAFARRSGSEFVYSFDDDFDAVDDVTRLATPVDPFEGEDSSD